MRRWALILGCYGLVAGPAQAGDRWPANACKDVQDLRTILEAEDPTAADRANQRFGILLLQEVHCGVDVKAEQTADMAVFHALSQPVHRETPRAPALWSAETCGHMEEMRVQVVGMDLSPYERAMWSLPILINLHAKCGVQNQMEFNSAKALMKTGDPSAASPPRKN
jgi:hypothetical protein